MPARTDWIPGVCARLPMQDRLTGLSAPVNHRPSGISRDSAISLLLIHGPADLDKDDKPAAGKDISGGKLSDYMSF